MQLLGDPHLGRSFIHGVPLDRRGDRERMQWHQFEHNILNSTEDTLGETHLCMGDLFDKAIVPYEVIRRAANAYMVAAAQNDKTQFIVLKGNHDWMRDLERPSAFDLWAKMVAHQKNILVVDTFAQIGNQLFFAWHPTISTKDMIIKNRLKGDTSFGHWDIESYGGDDTNLIPTKHLNDIGVTHAYTGHIHKAQGFSRDGVEVTVVGSMQPYAHGEESDSSLYQTIDLKGYREAPLGAFHNKCLRIELKTGELLDDDIDCLQLTVKREKTEETKMDVTLGEFNMTELFTESFKEAGVSDDVTSALLGQYESQRIAE